MVIEVENLVKKYGTVRAVDNISFQVNLGEVFGMLGPNGAGKTTTTEIIEGLRKADSGKVMVLGKDITRSSGEIKQKIGIQLQAPALLPLLSVKDLLETFAGFYKKTLKVSELLSMVSLQESQKVMVKQLSGGQQQRLSVAIALVNDPEIAFLDEPTTGLDPQARLGLWSVIEGMRKKEKTVFLTTHNMEEAQRLCDRIAIIDHGKIIALGSPETLIHEQFSERAIQFEMQNPPDKKILGDFPGTVGVVIDNREIIIYSRDIPATMLAILTYAEKNNLTGQLTDLHVREASLEDVFLKLTGRRIRE
jgi:ABC-2 type transport system ATP-binding protein